MFCVSLIEKHQNRSLNNIKESLANLAWNLLNHREVDTFFENIIHIFIEAADKSFQWMQPQHTFIHTTENIPVHSKQTFTVLF